MKNSFDCLYSIMYGKKDRDYRTGVINDRLGHKSEEYWNVYNAYNLNSSEVDLDYLSDENFNEFIRNFFITTFGSGFDNEIDNYINDHDTFKMFYKYFNVSQAISSGIISNTIVIDSQTLHDDFVISSLRDRIEKDNLSIDVRISDDNYTLTAEDFDRINFFNNIYVDNSEVNNNKVVLQNGIYKRGYEYVLPVDLERGSGNAASYKDVYHINHVLNDDELNRLVNDLNSTLHGPGELQLNFYDPSTYISILDRLKNAGLNSDIEIDIIGYPLVDRSELFLDLSNHISNKINVTYSTCHDMLNDLANEPYGASIVPYSQLEGGGKTTLNNYINILKFLEEADRHVKDNNFSPLESITWFHKYICDNYIYDPDVYDTNNPNFDISNDQNLSHVINPDSNGTKKAICLGFSTLYSAMARRNGIPMFRYNCPGHSRNILRIKDDKYGIDNIALIDSTNDNCDDHEHFYYFLVSPRLIPSEYAELDADGELTSGSFLEGLTIPNIFNINHSDFWSTNYAVRSNNADDLVNNGTLMDRSVNGLSSLGYTYRMLELMGYGKIDDIRDLYSLIYHLNDCGSIDQIDSNTIYSAIDRVRSVEDPNYDIDGHFRADYISDRDDLENFIFSSSNGTRLYDSFGRNFYSVDLINQNDINNWFQQNGSYVEKEDARYGVDTSMESIEVYHPGVSNYTNGNDISQSNSSTIDDDVYIAGTRIKKPRNRGIYESDEDYIEYLRNYYAIYFPEAVKDTESVYGSGYYHYTREEIIQDLPINSKEEQVFDTAGLSDDEIDASKILLMESNGIRKPRNRDIYESDEDYIEYLRNYYATYFPEAVKDTESVYGSGIYHYTREEIIQDLPINSKEEQVFDTVGLSDDEIDASKILLMESNEIHDDNISNDNGDSFTRRR